MGEYIRTSFREPYYGTACYIEESLPVLLENLDLLEKEISKSFFSNANVTFDDQTSQE